MDSSAALPWPPSSKAVSYTHRHVNKWLLAHPQAGIPGAHQGLVGENIQL